jgi:sugar phosphate isomerase/epimerase
MSGINTAIYEPANLFAWCVASHDPSQRSPEARAAMLQRLGFTGYAWGNRHSLPEHLELYHAEMQAIRRCGIGLVARYINRKDDVSLVIDTLKEYDLHPQLWVSPGHPSEGHSDEQRVHDEAERLRPTAQTAAEAGFQLAFYNHGGWFGHPLNLIRIIERMREFGLNNVGIAYCQHWGHEHTDSFEDFLPTMLPHLVSVTLNGMARGAGKGDRQMIPVGGGDQDLRLLGALAASGWRGPVGIVNHSECDPELRLADSLAGLAWIRKQLAGENAGPTPTFRTEGMYEIGAKP